MEWSDAINLKRFLPLQDVFMQIGQPPFRIDGRPVYYMGEGFLIGYTPRKFKVENMKRIEYDSVGEYLLGIDFYLYKSELLLNMNLQGTEYNFGGDILGNSFEIFNGICIGDTFKKVSKLGRANTLSIRTYNEGESRQYNKDLKELVFKGNWIKWGNYEMYFFGESKETRLSAFRYTPGLTESY